MPTFYKRYLIKVVLMQWNALGVDLHPLLQAQSQSCSQDGSLQARLNVHCGFGSPLKSAGY